MTLRLNGSTSGYTEIDAAATAGNNLVTLPTGTGAMPLIKLETAKSATGTAVDFTGIPSWVKRVTVVFNQVSLSGTSNIQIQLGDAGGIENTGYAGVSQYFGTGSASTAPTAGAQLIHAIAAASYLHAGYVLITNVTGNTWAIWGMSGSGTSGYSGMTICNKTLSDTLTQVRITTVNGTDTFDAGTINILYEG